MNRMHRKTILFVLATALLVAAIGCARKTPEEKLQEAQETFLQGDSWGAIVLAHEILRDHTTGTLALEARKVLVNAHMIDRNYKEARRVLNEIMDQQGLDSEAGQQAAAAKLRTYEMLGQRDLAIAQVSSFLEVATTGTLFWADLKLRLGSYLLADDQRSTAAEVLDDVFTNDQITTAAILSEALTMLADVYGTTETAQTGIEYFEAYLEDAPTTNLVPTVLMTMGRLSEVLDQTDQAQQYFDRAYVKYDALLEEATGADEKIPVLIRHARARSFAGDADEAIDLLKQGIEEFRSHPGRISLQYQMGGIYADNERTTEALQVFRDIATEYHNDNRRIDALFAIGDLLAMQDKYDEAAEEYRSILAMFSNIPNVARRAADRLRSLEMQRRRDAETSATLMFGEGPTTGAAALTSPTALATEPISLPPTTGTIKGEEPITPAVSLEPGAGAKTPSAETQPVDAVTTPAAAPAP